MPTKLQLRAGDILLYRPTPFAWSHIPGWFFGKAIAVKTWHSISHVEIYDGSLQSWAARDGVGFGKYPVRLSQLTYVLRPTVPLNLTAGRAWATSMIGTPYGWMDLLDFVGAPVDKKGIVCSPAAAGYLRACGWQVFPTDPINKVAPFQFLDLVDGCHCTLAYGPLTDADLPPIAA